jgi:hypothetical protein
MSLMLNTSHALTKSLVIEPENLKSVNIKAILSTLAT